jgi:hypothetical protein
MENELSPVPDGDPGLRHQKQRAALEELLARTTMDPSAFRKYEYEGQRRCFFNIVVALEWSPSPAYREVLEDAFRRASLLLLDVTDGYMAISQVAIGGPEFMPYADIQIFASNRLFPRASVDGLNNLEKYQPIRLGRGLWNKNLRATIPWNSQKGFATIVHEWGHYALGLKDQYLKLEQSSGLVLPQNQLASDTIMARLDRSDLLDNNDVRMLVNERRLLLLSPRNGPRDHDLDSEWEALRQHPRYRWLGIDPNHTKELKPPSEEVFPVFHIIPTTDDLYSPSELLFSLQDAGAGEQKIDPMHCWVFILKGTDEDPTERGFIAQGELERAGQLHLRGAQRDDEVVLIGHAQGKLDSPLVLRARITDDSEGIAHMGTWQDATPQSFPILDIVASGASAAPPYTIDLPYLNRDIWDATVFPLGRQRRRANTAVTGLDVLDGHIMLVSKGEGQKKIAIAGYALGGSPFSGYPGHPNPIPAGSADGNAMVLFYDNRDESLSYVNLYSGDSIQQKSGSNFDASKVVVTTNLQDNMPPPDGWAPRSYTFSITSNISFRQLVELHPTLVLHYDLENLENLDIASGDLIIGRYNPNTDSWDPLTTSLRSADFFVAASLGQLDGQWGLLADPPTADRFRLFLRVAASAS